LSYVNVRSGPQAQAAADSEPDVIRAFLLHPDVSRVVVGQFDDHHARGLGEGGSNLLDELFLALNIHWRKKFVLVDRLQQRLVLRLALIFSIRERRHVAQLPVQFQFGGALFRKFEQFFGGSHPSMVCRDEN
jgi:hypothetical protein